MARGRVPLTGTSRRYAAWLAAAYVLAASAWILVSSELAARFFPHVEALSHIEQFKGLLFVLVTGAGLFLGAQALFRRIETAAAENLRRERALVMNERRVLAGLLAASVAHDANNVLTGVLVDVDALRNADPDETAMARDRLAAAVQRLIGLNRRLVQMSRQNATTQAVSVDVGTTVREAVALARKHPALQEAKIHVASAEPISLVTQSLLLSQIVTNLVLNAGEATDGTGRVEVRVKRDAHDVLLEVHDSGPDVPAERRATLFEALESTKPQGNGIGLFSVRACARALGGDVEVLDSDFGGACFRVRLPRDNSASATA